MNLILLTTDHCNEVAEEESHSRHSYAEVDSPLVSSPYHRFDAGEPSYGKHSNHFAISGRMLAYSIFFCLFKAEQILEEHGEVAYPKTE